MAIVDYVDFVEFGNVTYVVPLQGNASVHAADLGPVVGRVHCQLVDSGAAPSYRAKTGDAAFVPVGAPLYSVHGWPASCRLAARHDSKLFVYLAQQQPGGDVSLPKICAVRHS
ncbi:MAG: hypothetical protein QOE20_5472 [Mycobacterium sp.]|nr:hypothetical protein [Mycobacterium sp.]